MYGFVRIEDIPKFIVLVVLFLHMLFCLGVNVDQVDFLKLFLSEIQAFISIFHV